MNIIKYSTTKLTTLSSLAALCCLFGTQTSIAVPAKPGLLTVEQADGTTLNVMLRGDERSHFYLSEDGYLLSNINDEFFYADVDASGNITSSDLRARNISERSQADNAYLHTVDMERAYSRLAERASQAAMRMAPKARFAPSQGPGLFPGTHFPSIGEQKAIVILVEYKDVKMTLDDAHDYFDRMLNEPGFSDYGGTGSAHDFFTECSEGQFDPQFDVFGPVTLSKNRSYYGGNDWWGNDEHPEEMVIEACQLLDETVDFSQYDRDGDGYIDNVFIFYAGRGEASGGTSDTVWPHSWDVSSATSTPYYFDGVRLDRYGCSNEYETGRPDGVGTFVHEFSHVMGLPDLYATTYTGAFTPGSWSALDYGPYNNDGCTPPLYGAFERYALGWIEPLPVDGPINATLYPIGTNQAGIIRTPKENEFFLLENRQKVSWDTYIPGHGMLVWHIDYNESIWNSNIVNNTSSHQYVDIEEADNTASDSSRAGDAFPGTANKTSFTDDTKPSMKTWNGTRLELPITDIAESQDGVITFVVCGGADPISPTEALEATDIESESFVANWKSAGENAKYVLNVYTRPEAGDEIEERVAEYVPGWHNRLVGNVTSVLVDGLKPETPYYYTVSVGNGWEQSEASEEILAYTGRLPLSRRAVKAIEPTQVGTTSFIATWMALEDAVGYHVNVYTKEYGATLSDGCDFTDGVKNLPKGWFSTSGSSYANTAYSGAAVPSLRLSTAADYLLTPEYDDYIRAFSFWHRGSSASEGDKIVVSARVAEKWTIIAEIPVVNDKGGVVTDITGDIPENTLQIRLGYQRTGTKGALAIDDITLGHGMTFSDVPLDGLTDYPAGDATECEIKGLSPDTEYYYTVRAYGEDDIHSLISKEIRVKTLSGNSGVAETAGTSVGIRSVGSAIAVDGAEGLSVSVVTADGKVLLNVVGESGMMLPVGPGLYIVKAGDKTARILVK